MIRYTVWYHTYVFLLLGDDSNSTQFSEYE